MICTQDFVFQDRINLGCEGRPELSLRGWMVGQIHHAKKYGPHSFESLLSLDIKNMFNCISRQTLRHIMATDFPKLLPFTDMLCATEGQTMVKLKDGSWKILNTKEGFSQGWSLSPIFAGIVLNHILRKLDKLLLERAYQQHRTDINNHATSDDGQGSIPIVIGYMDDVNALVNIQDVVFFVEHFKKLGLPLGAVLN